MFSLDPRLFLTQTEGSGSRLIIRHGIYSHAEVFSHAREQNEPGYVLTMSPENEVTHKTAHSHGRLHTVH